MSHILIIDDDIQFLYLIRTILQKGGHQVISANNGKKGIELYKENRFDLVITDMIMPELSGMNLISELLRKFPDAKIIAISGGGAIESERYLAVAESLGARKTITKPFTPLELLHAVDDVLTSPREDQKK